MGGLNQSAEKTSVTGDFTRRNLLEGIKRRLGSGDWRRGDMYGNYYDMKIDNTEKADDYFHCKANFEAAQKR